MVSAVINNGKSLVNIEFLPETGFVRLPTVLKVFPVSTASWWQGIRLGRYPKGVKLGPRTTAWNVRDIRMLIDSIQ